MNYSRREKFSIRKTTLGAVSARIAVIGLLSLMGLAQEVQADEFVTTSAEVVETETTATPETVTPEQVEQARQDLAVAQATVNQDQSAVEQATTAVEVAQENLALAQANLQASQELLAQATPEAVAQAEETVATEQANLAQLTEEKTAKEEQATEQDKQATATEKEAQAKADDLKKAEGELAKAEADLEQVNKETQEVKTAQANAEKALEQAQETLAKAEESEQDRQAAIAKAKEDWESKKSTEDASLLEVEQLTTALKTKTTELTQAEASLASAKAALDNDSQTVYPQTITVTEEWKQLFNEFLTTTKSKEPEKFNQLLEQLSELGEKFWEENAFTKDGVVYNSIDGEEKLYDPNNLPEDLINELNSYFTTLINSIHAQMGDGQTVVANTNIIKFAGDVAAEYKRLDELGNPDVIWWNMHNITAINNAAEQNGLVTSSINSYENAYLGVGQVEFATDGSLIYPDKVSRSYLFSVVYGTAAGMMLNDYGWAEGGHARSIYQATVLGLDFSMYPDDYDKESYYHLNVHVQQVDDYQIDLAKISREEYIALGEQAQALEQRYLDDYSPKIAELLDLQLEKILEQESYLVNGQISSDDPNWNRYNELTTEIENLTNEYLALKEEGEQLLQESREITEQARLNYRGTSEERQEIFETLYSVNSSDNLTDTKDSTTLQDNYKQAQTTYQQVKAQVDSLEQQVKAAETSYQEKQAATAQAKATYDQLLSGGIDKEQAQADLKKAQEAEQVAKTRLAELNQQLAQARQTLTDKQTAVDALKPLAEEAEKVASAERALADSLAKQLKTLEEALLTAQEQLATSRQTLADLQNAEANKELAQAELERAELAYETASNRLKELLATLATSRQVRDDKQTYLDYLTALLAQQTADKEAVDSSTETSTPGSDSEETDPTSQAGGAGAASGQAKPKADNLSGIGSADRPVLTATATTPTYSRTARAVAEKALPGTGEAGSVLTLLGLGLTSLGLVGRKRRKA